VVQPGLLSSGKEREGIPSAPLLHLNIRDEISAVTTFTSDLLESHGRERLGKPASMPLHYLL